MVIPSVTGADLAIDTLLAAVDTQRLNHVCSSTKDTQSSWGAQVPILTRLIVVVEELIDETILRRWVFLFPGFFQQ